MTTITVEALALREALENEHVDLVAARDQHTRDAAAAKARQADLRRQIAEAEVSRVTGKSVDTTKLRKELEATDPQASEEAARALNRAANAVPGRITQLVRERADDFAAAADEHTRRAEQAMRELETAYRAAFDAWQDADGAWSSMTQELDNAGVPSGLIGMSRGRGPRGVPAWPLPSPEAAFGQHIPAARPVGWIPPDQRGNATPGRYVGALGDIHDLDERGLLAHAMWLQIDRYGFAAFRRVEAEEIA